MVARGRFITPLLAAALACWAGTGLGQGTGGPGQYFDSEGTRIHYSVEGSGPPVVLIHGFSIDKQMNWAAVIPLLSQEFQVIAHDNRGHGRSEKPHDPETYGMAMVEDVVNLLDYLGIERAHIVGYSMGGEIALKFLATHPDRVRSAVIGGFGWNRPEGVGERMAEALEAVADTGGSTGAVILRMLGMPDTETLGPEARAVLDANDPRALAALVRSGGELAVSQEALSENRVPTLLLIGERDKLRPGVEPLLAAKPNARLKVLPDRTHVTALQDPGFGQAIFDFLRAHTKGDG